MTKIAAVPTADRPRLALALQGGGAHGAYGWGVIERLLEEEIEIVAVSGASAGALNGAALVAGLARGGRDGAREGLERLWHAVSAASPLRSLDGWTGAAFEPWVRHSLEMSKLFSRYVAPFAPQLRDMTPLRRVVADTIDMAALTIDGAIPLHVAATKVATGAARLFTGAEITLDALMASACLPDLFSAVEIEGEAYWDGGFSANPALDPLLHGVSGATDVLIVQITPFANESVPSSLPDVVARVSDIGFSACLMRDLRTLIEVQKIVREAGLKVPALQSLADTNLHLIEAPLLLAERGAASKIDTRASRLAELRHLGRETAAAWLDEHRHTFDCRSSLVEMPEELLA